MKKAISFWRACLLSFALSQLMRRSSGKENSNNMPAQELASLEIVGICFRTCGALIHYSYMDFNLQVSRIVGYTFSGELLFLLSQLRNGINA